MPWIAGGLVVALLAGLAAVGLHAVRRQHGLDPGAVVRTYLRAAQRGDVAALLRLTAPSQRAGVHGSPLPYRSGAMVVDRGAGIRAARLSPLSADEAEVGLSAHVCLRPSGRCGQLEGSVGSGDVLVVRESGRWWLTAQPFLLRTVAPRPAAVVATVSTELVLAGGLSVRLTDSNTVHDHHCATLGWRAFDFQPIEADDPVTLVIGPRDETLRPGTSRWPSAGFSLEQDTSLSVEWVPTRPVPVTISPDGRSGMLAIQGWVPHAVFDDGAARGEQPVNGRLTFRCND